jgi:hypothetical protein
MNFVMILAQSANSAQEWHNQSRGVIVMCLAFLALIGMAIWWLRR